MASSACIAAAHSIWLFEIGSPVARMNPPSSMMRQPSAFVEHQSHTPAIGLGLISATPPSAYRVVTSLVDGSEGPPEDDVLADLSATTAVAVLRARAEGRVQRQIDVP